MKNSNINICRPGYHASCALCCGSHNYLLDHGGLYRLFNYRKDAAHTSCGPGDGNPDYPALHRDALQCPWVGFTDDNLSLIGCLRYLDPPHDDRDFFNYTCRNFSCRAREILTDDEVLYAARLTGDWRYYGLLINEINTLKNLKEEYSDPERVPPAAISMVRKRLDDMLRSKPEVTDVRFSNKILAKGGNTGESE